MMYLIETHFWFLIAALVIGIVVGWVCTTPRRIG